jgi:hypothetical protein
MYLSNCFILSCGSKANCFACICSQMNVLFVLRARRFPCNSSVKGAVTLGALILTAALRAIRPISVSRLTSVVVLRFDALVERLAFIAPAISFMICGALSHVHQMQIMS